MALMGIAFVPVYVKYLGVEAYGLIGIFSLLQAWLTLFDLGMTPALSREMARYTGGAHDAQSIRNLLRTVEILGGLIALLMAIGIWKASGWLASDWLRAEKLPINEVAQAFSIMGAVTALRSLENIYRSSLVGLERQVLVNVVSCVAATVRAVGAVVVLGWIAPTIEAFFFWQALISIVTVLLMAGATYFALPRAPRRASFSFSSLATLWRFAAGIMVITLLSFLLMQIDKILLSKLLTLENFGYYTLAALIANSLFMLAGPIDLAFFPRFTSQASLADKSLLTKTFHLGAQLIAVLVGSAAIVLIVFADILLTLWTNDPLLSQRLSPLLSILSVGTLCNCLMHMPYQLQLSHGWTSLTIKVNTISVLVLVPAIFWLAPRYGSLGVAWVWVVLNGGYVFVVAHLVFQRLLVGEKWRWYAEDVFLPLIVAAVVAVLLRLLLPSFESRLANLILLFICSVITLLMAGLAAPLVRTRAVGSLKKLQFFDGRI